MNKDLDYTMKFEGISDDKMSVSQALDFVNEALLEKGYNPINQIIGYLLSGDSSYITGVIMINELRCKKQSNDKSNIFIFSWQPSFSTLRNKEKHHKHDWI